MVNAELRKRMVNSAEYDDELDDMDFGAFDPRGEMSSETQRIPKSADLGTQRITRGTVENPRQGYDKTEVYWDQYR